MNSFPRNLSLSLSLSLTLTHTHNAHTHRLLLWQKSFLARVVIIVIAGLTIIFIRFYLNGGEPPLFVESDNPASFSPHLSTRFFTYVHLAVLNLWLLICPSRLCFDWSMDSISLIQSASDVRNIWSVLVAVLLVIFLFSVGMYIIMSLGISTWPR